jgi:LPPG:FO 2-phospho-L-lactate transferase
VNEGHENPDGSIVVLAGGVGGARFVDGVSRVLDPGSFCAVINTADDLVHWGLQICPDLDTNMYTLAGIAPRSRGWGLVDETFETLDRMKQFGEPAWFALSDQDIATHLVRTKMLGEGHRLTDITKRLCDDLGVNGRLLPMTDGTRSTEILTVDGERFPFQDWLVKHRAERAAREVVFSGTDLATDDVLDALDEAKMVVIAPSNPYVSIDPIITLAGVRERLEAKPVVAISPIICAEAVKGPLASMMVSIANRSAGVEAICAHYGGLLDAIVVDPRDAFDWDGGLVWTADILIERLDKRSELVREVLRRSSAQGWVES